MEHRIVQNRKEDYYSIEGQVNKMFSYLSENHGDEILKIFNLSMRIFKPVVVNFNLNTDYSSRNNLNVWLAWIDDHSNSFQVGSISFHCHHEEDLQFFFENYNRKTETLLLFLNFPAEELTKPTPKVSFDTNNVEIRNIGSHNFNLVKLFDCLTLQIYNSSASEKDFNSFLKNWQQGLTNARMKWALFVTSEERNLKKILEGTGATYRDPRTVKRHITVRDQSFYVFGGIDIENVNGSIATLQWNDYRMMEIDAEVPQDFIQVYEDAQDPTGEHRDIELQTFSLSIFVW